MTASFLCSINTDNFILAAYKMYVNNKRVTEIMYSRTKDWGGGGRRIFHRGNTIEDLSGKSRGVLLQTSYIQK